VLAAAAAAVNASVVVDTGVPGAAADVDVVRS
jgi:hypothetical protein